MWGSEGLAMRGGRQLTGGGGEQAVSRGDGSGIEATLLPGLSMTTISVEEGLYLPLGTAWKLWSGPSSYFSFFFRIFTHCKCI